MNNRERLSFLLGKYIHNTCSAQELNELFLFVDLNENKEQLLEELKSVWQATSSEQQHTDAEWDTLYVSMMQFATDLPDIKLNRKLRLWTKIAIAGVVLIALPAAFIFYMYHPASKSMQAQQAKSGADLAPGSNKAVLILDNGSRIVLDGALNGEVAMQTGVEITKTADGQLIYTIKDTKSSSNEQLSFNTIETPKGGQYQITMPDGSNVWLNAQSSLKYPVHFDEKERKVELSGEAYFEVARREGAPFRVLINTQIVEVLGTHFNINGYKDETSIKTTLLEGSVKVSFTDNKNRVLLKPGQQASFEKNELNVNSVDAEEAIAWKNGYFMFNNSNLEDIMRQISRWYNVEVVYQNSSARKQVFSGSVSRFKYASQVLSILELTGLVHFKMEEGRITVML